MFGIYYKNVPRHSDNTSIGCVIHGDVTSEVIIDGNEDVNRPFEGLDARAFDVRSVLETGQKPTPSPKYANSPSYERDKVDAFFKDNKLINKN